MSETETTYSWQFAQTLFPDVPIDEVSPTVKDVAMLEHTRTVDDSGDEIGDFTSDTRPTDADVTLLIGQAVMIILDQLDVQVAPALYPAIKEAVTLEAAILVESSFFREQMNEGSVSMYSTILAGMIKMLQVKTGTATGDGTGSGAGGVDSVMVRGVMAEWDPFLPEPPLDPVFEWEIDSANDDTGGEG